MAGAKARGNPEGLSACLGVSGCGTAAGIAASRSPNNDGTGLIAQIMNRFSVILNGMIFCPANGLPPFFERPGLLAQGVCAATRAANVRAKASCLSTGSLKS
jgi:hypothetical protein